MAVPFVAGAGVAHGVSFAASSAKFAFKVDRHFASEAKKQECKDAIRCLHRLRRAGYPQFDSRWPEMADVLQKNANEKPDKVVKTLALAEAPELLTTYGVKRELEGIGNLPPKMTNKEKLAAALTPTKKIEAKKLAVDDQRTGYQAPSQVPQNGMFNEEQQKALDHKEKGIGSTIGHALGKVPKLASAAKEALVDDLGSLVEVTGFDREQRLDNALNRPGRLVELGVERAEHLTNAELKALKKMQDHAVKHWMRGAEPLLPVRHPVSPVV